MKPPNEHRTDRDNNMTEQAEEEENEMIYKDRLLKVELLLQSFRRQADCIYTGMDGRLDLVEKFDELKKLDREYTKKIAGVFE